jgi:phosphoserine phosphatase
MRVESLSRVFERIQEAMVGTVGPVMTSDADGTLWAGDVGDDAFECLLEERGVREVAREALCSEARSVGLEPRGDPTDVAQQLFESFRTGALGEAKCYEMMAWAFAGWTPDEVRAFARRMFRERGLRQRIHGEMGAVVDWARERGIPLWIVSASPLFVVEAGVEHFGIPRERIIAATPIVQGGRVGTRLAYPIPYGEGKVQGIDREMGSCRIVAAFGDEAFDLEMLRRAAVPVAVRPKARLRKRAAEIPELVQLAEPDRGEDATCLP